MAIRPLPPQLINQIAAGEVIERPAAVIKELVENACDAGATQIEIWYEGSGIRRLCVRDNGMGIPKSELPFAIARHATSKIATLADLFQIGTLGFRGEALASIAAISQFCLTSKPADQEMAYAVTVEGMNCLATVLPASHPQGTTVVVADLFFNTPVRRKFLRSDKTEALHIEDTVRRLALSHFTIDFTLWAEDKQRFQLPAAFSAEDRTQRVQKLLSKQFIDTAMTIDCAQGPLRLWGWLGTPDYQRRQSDQQILFVQQRWVKDKVVAHAINQIYQSLLPPGMYASYVLYLELPVDTIDVNVHPTKQEVRFHHPRQVHDFVQSHIAQALDQWKTPGNRFVKPISVASPSFFYTPSAQADSLYRDIAFLNHYRLMQLGDTYTLINLEKASRYLLAEAWNGTSPISQTALAVPLKWDCGKDFVCLWEALSGIFLYLGLDIRLFSLDTVIITQIPSILLGVHPLESFLLLWWSALNSSSDQAAVIAHAIRYAPRHIAGARTPEELMPYLDRWRAQRIAAELTDQVLTTVC